MWPHLEGTHTSVFFIKKTGKGMANIPVSRGEAQILTREEKVQWCDAQVFRNVNCVYVIQCLPGAELTLLRPDLNCWTARAFYYHLSCLFSLYLDAGREKGEREQKGKVKEECTGRGTEE